MGMRGTVGCDCKKRIPEGQRVAAHFATYPGTIIPISQTGEPRREEVPELTQKVVAAGIVLVKREMDAFINDWKLLRQEDNWNRDTVDV